MHVIAYNFASVFGGQERYLESLALELEERGHTVNVNGGPERILRCRASRPAGGPTVELLNGYRALYLRAWRTKKTDLRLFVLHADVDFNDGRRYKLWVRHILLRLLLTRTDAIVRVCRKALPDHLAPRQVRTIYNGVPLPEVPAEPDGARPFTLLMVGAITKLKNQILALELLQHLPEVHLVLVGEGPQREEWQNWAEANGLSDRVTWTGFVSDPSTFYRSADALLLLSRFEAFPYAVIEAMSYGLPVIAVPVGGVPEAITNGVDGILLNASDPGELRAAVSDLLLDTEAARRMGRAARETVRRRFTLETMVEQFLRVVCDLSDTDDRRDAGGASDLEGRQ